MNSFSYQTRNSHVAYNFYWHFVRGISWCLGGVMNSCRFMIVIDIFGFLFFCMNAGTAASGPNWHLFSHYGPGKPFLLKFHKIFYYYYYLLILLSFIIRIPCPPHLGEKTTTNY